MSARFLLDSSFVIDLLNEIAAGHAGPAMNWLEDNPRAQLWISPVTLGEVLEGADDVEAVRAYLARFRWQGIHRAHAAMVAAIQRQMGENDAWQVAVSAHIQAVVLGHDRAFTWLGERYQDHHASVPHLAT